MIDKYKKYDKDTSLNIYYHNVCKCLVLFFDYYPEYAVRDAKKYMDMIKEYFESKETIYDCALEIRLSDICG